MDAERDWSKPREVADVEMVFPTALHELLPPWSELPEEFQRGGSSGGNHWCDQASTWFYSGVNLKESTVTPKRGIDSRAAFRHLQVCLGSWEPKHEHKIAGVGYLMSLWFDNLEFVGRKEVGDGR